MLKRIIRLAVIIVGLIIGIFIYNHYFTREEVESIDIVEMHDVIWDLDDDSNIDVYYSSDINNNIEAYIRDVKTDKIWSIIGDIENLDDNDILLVDENNNELAYTLQQKEDYIVIIPVKAFEEGQSYKILLSDKIQFYDEAFKNAKTLVFTTIYTEEVDVSYSEEVIEISSDLLESNDKVEKLVLNELEVEVGNILIIEGGHENGSSDLVYKVTSVEYKEGKSYVEFENPSIEDVYEEISIHKTYGYEDGLEVAIDTEALEEQFVHSNLIDYLSMTVYAEEKSNERPGIKVTYKGNEDGYQVYDLQVTFEDYIKKGTDLKISMEFKLDIDFLAFITLSQNNELQSKLQIFSHLKMDSDLKVKVESGRKVEGNALIAYDFASTDNVKELENKIKKDIDDNINQDKSLWDGFEIELADINIPMSNTINLSFEGKIFLKNSISLDNITVNDEISFGSVVTVSYDLGSLPRISAQSFFHSSLGDISIVGVVGTKLGVSAKIELEILKTAGIGIEYEKGIQSELKGMINLDQGEKSGLYYKYTLGDYHEIKAVVELERKVKSDIELVCVLSSADDNFNEWFETGNYKVAAELQVIEVDESNTDIAADLEEIYLNANEKSEAKIAIQIDYYDIFNNEHLKENVKISDVELTYDSNLVNIDSEGLISIVNLEDASTTIKLSYEGFEISLEIYEIEEEETIKEIVKEEIQLIEIEDPEMELNFINKDFHRFVRQQFDLGEDITWGDVGYIEYFSFEDANIEYAEDLKWFTNLTMISSLWYTPLAIDIADLKPLTNLQHIDFHMTDITGDLNAFNDLVNLKYLELPFNNITGTLDSLNAPYINYINLMSSLISGNIDNLYGLDRLRILLLNDTNVAGDIDVLSSLEKIEDLDLSNTEVSGDIESLSELMNLKTLDLSDTNVEGDLSSLSQLKNLERLNIDRTKVTGSVTLSTGEVVSAYREVDKLTLSELPGEYNDIFSLELFAPLDQTIYYKFKDGQYEFTYSYPIWIGYGETVIDVVTKSSNGDIIESMTLEYFIPWGPEYIDSEEEVFEYAYYYGVYEDKGGNDLLKSLEGLIFTTNDTVYQPLTASDNSQSVEYVIEESVLKLSKNGRTYSFEVDYYDRYIIISNIDSEIKLYKRGYFLEALKDSHDTDKNDVEMACIHVDMNDDYMYYITRIWDAIEMNNYEMSYDDKNYFNEKKDFVLNITSYEGNIDTQFRIMFWTNLDKKIFIPEFNYYNDTKGEFLLVHEDSQYYIYIVPEGIDYKSDEAILIYPKD